MSSLENTRDPRSIQRVVIRLLKWLGAPDQAELSRSFATWFNEVFVPRQGNPEQVPAFQDLQEVDSMLQETVQKWYKEAEQKGKKEGKKEGEKEGLVKLILSQVEAKFGKISSADRKIVRAAETETLLEWGARIITAETIDEVFDR